MADIAVIICTRNRPDSLEVAVRSILDGDDSDFDLVVMDQSEGEATREVMAGVEDRRLRYVRADRLGKSAALNDGIALTEADVIVCTDDDCEAPPGWVTEMTALIEDHPDAGVAFCRVTAGPHDPVAGYIPTFECRSTTVLEKLGQTRRLGRGIGAGMALRRDAMVGFGGADELLGPGARFGACEDWDIEVRMLLSGWHSVHSAEVQIVHHGFRKHSEGAEHARRDWLGIGAEMGKLARAGVLSALPIAAWELTTNALGLPLGDLIHLRRPRGLSRLVSFSRGFCQGAVLQVDHTTLRFRRP